MDQLHDNVFERECEAISGNFALFARNCLTSTFKYIVMQMKKGNCEKGYWTVRVRARALMDQLHLNKLFFKTYFANKTVVYSFSGTFSSFSFANFVIDMINW